MLSDRADTRYGYGVVVDTLLVRPNCASRPVLTFDVRRGSGQATGEQQTPQRRRDVHLGGERSAAFVSAATSGGHGGLTRGPTETIDQKARLPRRTIVRSATTTTEHRTPTADGILLFLIFFFYHRSKTSRRAPTTVCRTDTGDAKKKKNCNNNTAPPVLF